MKPPTDSEGALDPFVGVWNVSKPPVESKDTLCPPKEPRGVLMSPAEISDGVLMSPKVSGVVLTPPIEPGSIPAPSVESEGVLVLPHECDNALRSVEYENVLIPSKEFEGVSMIPDDSQSEPVPPSESGTASIIPFMDSDGAWSHLIEMERSLATPEDRLCKLSVM